MIASSQSAELRPDLTTVAEYEARFQAECAGIQLEPGIVVCGPFLSFTELPSAPPWMFELCLFFPDAIYTGTLLSGL
ncbi:MAG: hypothetical protein ACYDC6_14920 [Acidobacteriaceae bacterium]